jgi:hypothetical protein
MYLIGVHALSAQRCAPGHDSSPSHALSECLIAHCQAVHDFV